MCVYVACQPWWTGWHTDSMKLFAEQQREALVELCGFDHQGMWAIEAAARELEPRVPILHGDALNHLR